MRAILRVGGFNGPRRLRNQTVEPVFGQIKAARGVRPLRVRGKAKVADEWALVCAAGKLLKVARNSPSLA